ncbi:hypothetical protein MMC06_000959 [Schaereria dolodes]|nr:hypothetical protein [Schaereria dolodes]
MSTEPDVTSPIDPRRHKKSRGKSEGKKEKKRKRPETIEHADFPPTKKHHSHKSSQLKAPTIENTSREFSIEKSPFHHQASSLYLPLSPISQLNPLQGLCAEHLSPLVLTYYPPFHGVVLSYSNVRLSEHPEIPTSEGKEGRILAQSIDEYAVSFVWVTADFLIFKPQKGGRIEGWINLQNEGHIGLVCWNLFNASIERKRLPKEWRWVQGGKDIASRRNTDHEGTTMDVDEAEAPVTNGSKDTEGYFEDVMGRKIEGSLLFAVNDIQTSSSSDREKGFISIEGTMLNEAQEQQLQDQNNNRRRGTGHNLLSRTHHLNHSKSAALIDRQLDDVDRSRISKYGNAV